LKNIKNYAEILKQNLPSLKIASLHGKMSAKEKNEIMSSFSKGETDVLVSTTVIEVGVNVPNASLMIIENAERFGLAQLHQLRGRVGRGTRKSYCVLVSDSESDTAKSRLEIMKTTYDGYEIAEKDLLLRGPGDFFGRTSEELRQSGGFEFKMAKLCDDTELFNAAFASAKQIISSDPELLKLENYGLRELLHNKFEHNSSNIS
jgi:ATP-dependent DNA helicase RecG